MAAVPKTFTWTFVFIDGITQEFDGTADELTDILPATQLAHASYTLQRDGEDFSTFGRPN